VCLLIVCMFGCVCMCVYVCLYVCRGAVLRCVCGVCARVLIHLNTIVKHKTSHQNKEKFWPCNICSS